MEMKDDYRFRGMYDDLSVGYFLRQYTFLESEVYDERYLNARVEKKFKSIKTVLDIVGSLAGLAIFFKIARLSHTLLVYLELDYGLWLLLAMAVSAFAMIPLYFLFLMVVVFVFKVDSIDDWLRGKIKEKIWKSYKGKKDGYKECVKDLDAYFNAKDKRILELEEKLRTETLNAEIEVSGRLFVYGREIEKLRDLGLYALAAKVELLSENEREEVAYDIKSYDQDGKEFYINVKTTEDHEDTGFFMSSKELIWLEATNFYIYRVYEFEKETNKGYVNIILGQEDSEEYYMLIPTEYRMLPKV